MLNRDANFSLNQIIMSVRRSSVKKQQAMMVDILLSAVHTFSLVLS